MAEPISSARKLALRGISLMPVIPAEKVRASAASRCTLSHESSSARKGFASLSTNGGPQYHGEVSLYKSVTFSSCALVFAKSNPFRNSSCPWASRLRTHDLHFWFEDW